MGVSTANSLKEEKMSHPHPMKIEPGWARVQTSALAILLAHDTQVVLDHVQWLSLPSGPLRVNFAKLLTRATPVTTFPAFSTHKTADPLPPSPTRSSLLIPSNKQIEELHFHHRRHVRPPAMQAQPCPSPSSPHPLRCQAAEGRGRAPPLKPQLKQLATIGAPLRCSRSQSSKTWPCAGKARPRPSSLLWVGQAPSCRQEEAESHHDTRKVVRGAIPLAPGAEELQPHHPHSGAGMTTTFANCGLQVSNTSSFLSCSTTVIPHTKRSSYVTVARTAKDARPYRRWLKIVIQLRSFISIRRVGK
jgi:hypothetical protein